MNEADSRHLSSQLESIGYQFTEDSDQADLVVLNTCVVRQQAEDKAMGRLRNVEKFKEARPSMTVALMGCMVGMREEDRLKKKYPFVDVFMPPSETRPLLEYLSEQSDLDPDEAADARDKAVRNAIQDEEHILPALQKGSSVTAHVPIVLGCSHACTFCIIPYRRGAERSRPSREILNEVERLAEQGIREVMLLGQIVDRYGMDLEGDMDLADLLLHTADVPGLHRVRFLTSHPNYMSDKIIDVVAGHPKICPQFEIPAQAGSNTMLERMRRRYTIEDYEAMVDRIRTRCPDAAIHTDIIVGFCGETDEEFMDTYRHIERVRPDKIHLAKYSERPKTIASRRMPDDVPPEVKEERRKLIHDLQTARLTEKMSTMLHETTQVLVEGMDRKNLRWRGRNPQGKLVFFDQDRDCLSELVDVRIERTSPYSLIGSPVARSAPTPAGV